VTALVSRGARYIATVAPASVGLVTVKVRAGAVADAEGNLNAADSNTVTVSYFAGECSLELGCQWQLAMYQHQLALDRLSEESALETQRAVEVQRVQEKAAQRREELKLEAEAAGLKVSVGRTPRPRVSGVARCLAPMRLRVCAARTQSGRATSARLPAPT
jgi:hypothetical protein